MFQHGQRAQRTERRRTRPRDPAPLSPRQLSAVVCAVVRELSWILPNTAKALRRWRARGLAAADAVIREDAVSALTNKRPQSEGAALLAILASGRCTHLLSALLCYQIIWDGLDSIHERAPDRANGLQLHHAVRDALRPWQTRHAYYELHGCDDDAGYLEALVSCCQEAVTRLPAFPAVQPLVLREAVASSQVLPINHEPVDSAREASMRAWANRERPHPLDERWFERGASSGAALTTFAALAHASAPNWQRGTIDCIRRTYPWASAVATLLDSYADRAQDAITGDHVYINHYDTLEDAAHRTSEMIRNALEGTDSLRDRFLPKVVIASMTAMYLTKDSLRTGEARDHLRHISRSGGSLTVALMPIVRLWRILYAVRSS